MMRHTRGDDHCQEEGADAAAFIEFSHNNFFRNNLTLTGAEGGGNKSGSVPWF